MHANRNGYFYVLDRTTGEFLRATPFVERLNWAKGIDAKGKPIENPGMEPSPNGTRVCPSVRGATNWMSPSYNPQTGLLYVPTLEQCDVYSSSAKTPEPMKNFAGTGGESISKEPGKFYLRAVDATTGRHLWHYYLGQTLTASPITFLADGKQYVTIVSATDVLTFALFEPVDAERK